MYPNLKLQLFRTGIRQNRLAQSLGMDESILSKIVNGFREPSQEVRARIASLLDTDEEWLFQRLDPPANHARNNHAEPDAAPSPLESRGSSDGI
ncbi:MAG TPA: helix-turn-helix transcriptional regulator [Bryobacteraceae bacterium]|nr:helix-turn-helix transcriptional regulator [Bryobacteraceae bacterium]